MKPWRSIAVSCAYSKDKGRSSHSVDKVMILNLGKGTVAHALCEYTDGSDGRAYFEN